MILKYLAKIMEIKNIVLIVVFVLGLVYMQLLQARSVDEIINKYAAARGGKDKLNSITSLYMEGLRDMLGRQIVVRIIKVQGKLYRNDFEFEGNTGYTLVTPAAGWSFFSMRSKSIESMPEERLRIMQTELDIVGPLINHSAKGHKAGLVGKDYVEGREAYKIKLTLNTGKEIVYLLDMETHLLLQIRQMSPAIDKDGNDIPGPARELVTNFGDYKPVDGILFPHRINTVGAGLGAGTTIFSKIELNQPVDRSMFVPSV